MSSSLERSNNSSTISTSLLERVRAREPRAWERLVELYGPVVYEWARRAGVEPNDAADVVQETFRSVLKSVGAFRRNAPGDSFRGWLWTIARNKIRDRARHHRVEEGAAGGTSAFQRILDIPDAAESDSMPEGGTFHLARRALDLVRSEFGDHVWQAFWRVSVEGARPDLVAEELGLSVRSVYTAKCRVLRRLRETLGADF
jgi:RNA polymerase sigma-70 factor, ECF subfamily